MSRYSAPSSMQSSRPNDRGTAARFGSGLAVDEVVAVLVDQLEGDVVLGCAAVGPGVLHGVADREGARVRGRERGDGRGADGVPEAPVPVDPATGCLEARR